MTNLNAKFCKSFLCISRTGSEDPAHACSRPAVGRKSQEWTGLGQTGRQPKPVWLDFWHVFEVIYDCNKSFYSANAGGILQFSARTQFIRNVTPVISFKVNKENQNFWFCFSEQVNETYTQGKSTGKINFQRDFCLPYLCPLVANRDEHRPQKLGRRSLNFFDESQNVA